MSSRLTRRRDAPHDPATLAALTADPANRRKHNERNIAAIVDSLKAVGAARSIVIDEHDVILAGNGVTQAAKSAGLTKLRVIEATGDEVIAVRRRGLTDAQKRALAIGDNRSSELATWNVAQLLADQAAGLELDAWWTDEELAALLTPDGGPKEGNTDPDAVPEVRATDIQRGDLFALGAHRILCGDATDAGDVARVMGSETADACISDPPYGVGLDTDYTRFTRGLAPGRKHKRITGDAQPFDPAPFLGFDAVVLFGANYFAQALPRGTWLVWDKRFNNGEAWLSDAELAWMKTGTGVYVFSLTSQGFVRPEPVQHPTQKPVALLAWCIEKAKAGAVVYDPFLGSGTTLIACEQLTRACRAVEIEPQYVQVAIDRWEQFTGLTAQKIGDAVRAPSSPKSVTHHTVTPHARQKTRAAAAQAAPTAPTRAPQPPARRRREKA